MITLCPKLQVTHLHSGIDTMRRINVFEAVQHQGSIIQEYCEVVGVEVIVGEIIQKEGIALAAVKQISNLDAEWEEFLRGECALA